MSATYLPHEMANKDRVRYRIGDTDSSSWLLADEEINDLLTLYSLDVATYHAASAAAAKLSRDVGRSTSGTVGGGSSSRGQRFLNMMRIVEEWKARVGGNAALMPVLTGFSGSTSQSFKDSQESDTDRVEPFFTRDLFDTTDSETDELTD